MNVANDRIAADVVDVRGHRLMLPSTDRGLPSVRERVLRLVDENPAGATLVVAIDGIGFDIAREHLSAPSLTPLTSVFPSTSVAAWLSVVTGQRPDQHGVLGTVTWDETAGEVVSYLGDHAYGWAGSVDLPPDRLPRPAVGSTLFTDVASRGIEPSAEVTGMADWSSGWVRAMTAGATVRSGAGTDWLALEEDPAALVSAAMRAAAPTSGGPAFSFVYLNFDDHLHAHGFDEAVADALAVLNREAEALACRGVTVVAVSDHGQCPSVAPADMTAAWRELAGRRWCRRPAGGAGRVRWVYPRPGAEDAVRGGLERELGAEVLVTSPRGLADLGLWSRLDVVERTVGEIVVVGLGDNFPAPVAGYRWEHGSATEPEMIVPLAVWSHRHV